VLKMILKGLQIHKFYVYAYGLYCCFTKRNNFYKKGDKIRTRLLAVQVGIIIISKNNIVM